MNCVWLPVRNQERHGIPHSISCSQQHYINVDVPWEILNVECDPKSCQGPGHPDAHQVDGSHPHTFQLEKFQVGKALHFPTAGRLLCRKVLHVFQWYFALSVDSCNLVNDGMGFRYSLITQQPAWAFGKEPKLLQKK